jgi:sugar phosphate isomerase/epimerase
MTRRDFVRLGAGAVAAGVWASRLSAKPLGLPIGLQLYSVHELLPKDFDGTLALVREAGFTEVEAAGYHDRTAADWRKALDKAGLRCVGSLHPLDAFKAKLDELIEYGHVLGLGYLGCVSANRRDPEAKGPLTLDDWRWVAGEYNRIGEKIKAAGMSFAIHNGVPEFGSEGGVVFYDELLRLTDPKLVCFELDCGWMFAAGRNPAEYLIKTPERFPLLHIKDMVKGDMVKGATGEMHSSIMGRGVIDYRPILRAATGMKHYFVEQEVFDMDVMESLRLDAAYMKKLEL